MCSVGTWFPVGLLCVWCTLHTTGLLYDESQCLGVCGYPGCSCVHDFRLNYELSSCASLWCLIIVALGVIGSK